MRVLTHAFRHTHFYNLVPYLPRKAYSTNGTRLREARTKPKTQPFSTNYGGSLFIIRAECAALPRCEGVELPVPSNERKPVALRASHVIYIYILYIYMKVICLYESIYESDM